MTRTGTDISASDSGDSSEPPAESARAPKSILTYFGRGGVEIDLEPCYDAFAHMLPHGHDRTMAVIVAGGVLLLSAVSIGQHWFKKRPAPAEAPAATVPFSGIYQIDPTAEGNACTIYIHGREPVHAACRFVAVPQPYDTSRRTP